MPINKNISLKDAAYAFVNPMTVVNFIEIVKGSNKKAMVHYPGSSQLGL